MWIVTAFMLFDRNMRIEQLQRLFFIYICCCWVSNWLQQMKNHKGQHRAWHGTVNWQELFFFILRRTAMDLMIVRYFTSLLLQQQKASFKKKKKTFSFIKLHYLIQCMWIVICLGNGNKPFLASFNWENSLILWSGVLKDENKDKKDKKKKKKRKKKMHKNVRANERSNHLT